MKLGSQHGEYKFTVFKYKLRTAVNIQIKYQLFLEINLTNLIPIVNAMFSDKHEITKVFDNCANQ